MIRNCGIALVLALTSGVAAVAAPVATKDAADFNFRWDFNGATTAENYDRYNNTTGAAGGDGTNDWLTQPAPTGGAITVTNGSMSNTYWGSAAGLAAINTTTGYTIEHRVKAAPVLGLNGLSIDAGIGTGLAAVAFKYTDSTKESLAVYWSLTGASGSPLATVDADEFVTVRIVATPNASDAVEQLDYSVYINGALVGDNLSRVHSSTARRFLLGDVGSGDLGQLTIDSTAYTPGAFAPVPEPASMALLAAGAGLVLGRRRA